MTSLNSANARTINYINAKIVAAVSVAVIIWITIR